MQWLTLLPPLLAIGLALWKREVVLALLSALLCAEWLLSDLHPGLAFIAVIDRLVSVFANPANTEILLFSLLIGALLNLFRQSGGVTAFVEYLLERNLATTPRRVGMMTGLLGVFIFIESNLSILASGIFAQRLYDRFNMSRARLAYMIDSTCAPVSILILLNAWGAYVLGLLEGYGLDTPLQTLLGSIPLNFYALFALAMTFYTAWSNRVFFSLARYEEAQKVDSQNSQLAPASRKRYFLVPLALLVGGIIGFMLYTGEGELFAGSGSSSVLYATVLALLSCFVLLRRDSLFSLRELLDQSWAGMAELLPLVTVVLLALALGASMQALGTGDFIAGMISANLPQWSVAALVFIAAGLISFCTGTSWGTFGIMIPVAIPIATATGLPPQLLLAAVLGGGVFGDHCSPISDSTILASLASGCDHLDHVRTQLPYALLCGGLATLCFVVATLGHNTGA